MNTDMTDQDEPMLGVSFTTQDALEIVAWNLEAQRWGQSVFADLGGDRYDQMAHIGLFGDAAFCMFRRVGDGKLVIDDRNGNTVGVVDSVTEARGVVAGLFWQAAIRSRGGL